MSHSKKNPQSKTRKAGLQKAGSPTPLDEKVCLNCGIPFSWRKKWERNWEQVKFCSSLCRNQAGSALNQKIEESLLEALKSRSSSACPSEIARKLFDEKTWKKEMERVRQAARRLAHAGKIQITQNGKVVDPGRFKGPIRVQRVKSK